MNNKQTEARLRQAVSATTPDPLEAILRSCDEVETQPVSFPQPVKKASRRARFGALAAAAAMVLFGFVWNDSRTVVSTVSLDVNPSIQIEANRREQVLRVTPLNEAGAQVIAAADLSASGLDKAVNALVEAMVQYGYLSADANSILLSVNDSDPARGTRLQQELSRSIDRQLQKNNISPAVLSQTVTEDAALSLLACANNISTGKAKLVCQMTAQNSFYSEEELAALPINDLSLLNSNLDNISCTGQASDGAYIGKTTALSIALEHVGISPALVSRWEVEMDYDDGRMLYDVEFLCPNGAFEYTIDARTGEILGLPEVELDRDAPDPGVETSGQITVHEALRAALTHAGLTEDITLDACAYDLGEERGVPVYELTFCCGTLQYEYEIHAQTGEVLKYQRKTPFLPSGTGLYPADFTTPYVPEGGAKLSALSHSGLTEAQITDYECETSTENGHTVYEIEFKSNGWEYHYKIHGGNGLVLEHGKEWDD